MILWFFILKKKIIKIVSELWENIGGIFFLKEIMVSKLNFDLTSLKKIQGSIKKNFFRGKKLKN